MIFADPPYHLSNGGFSVHAGKQVSVNKGDWDVSNGLKKDYEFHLNWIKECRRVLKQTEQFGLAELIILFILVVLR